MTRLLWARRARSEDGFALVVALVITLLVFLLTTAMLADAFHNIVGSANSRERLTAINAAEAGVSWYARLLESTGLGGLTSAPNFSGSGNEFKSAATTVQGVPGSGSFTVTARYFKAYDSSTDTLSDAASGFATYTDTTIPQQLWVELESVGTARSVTRKVRVVMDIRALHGTVAGAFAGIYICELGNRFTVTGPSADVYLLAKSLDSEANCPLNKGGAANANVLAVTSGQFSTSGNVFALYGGVCLTNTSKIDGSLWALGPITLGGPTACNGVDNGGAVGKGNNNVCSSTNNASILVCGNVTSLAAAPSVNNGARVLGTSGQCTGCALPELNFLQLALADAAKSFPSPDWTEVSSIPSLTSASTPVNKTLVYLYKNQTSCTAAAPTAMPKGTLYLKTDVAILSPCGFSFSGRTDVRAAPGTKPTLYLITGYAASCSAALETTFTQNFDASAIRIFIYTPCKLSFRNQVNVTGQLIARTLYAQGQTTINTIDVLTLSGTPQPGYVSGFQSRILNIREI